MTQNYMMVTQTALAEDYGPVMLPPHRAWLTLSLYLPEDISVIRDLNPEAMEGAPDLGPEDSMAILHHNHIEREDLVALLESALEALKGAEVPE